MQRALYACPKLSGPFGWVSPEGADIREQIKSQKIALGEDKNILSRAHGNEEEKWKEKN